MPRRNPSSRKAATLPPRTLAKLHRAVATARPHLEPLETRRLLTSIWLNYGGLVASEDGRYAPQITLHRSDTNGFTDVALSLAGQGANPASPSDFTLAAEGLGFDQTLISFPSGQTQIPLSLAAVNDDLLEADEVLRVAVADPADPSTPLDSCDVYIKSDDNEIWISGGGLMTEGGATVQFTVHREDLGGACTNPATVTVRLKSAGEGELRASLDDYTFSDSVIGSQGPDPDSCLFDLDFAADQATRTITVSAIDDAHAEPEEWLKLVLLYANLAGDPAQPVPLSAALPTQVFAGITDNDTPLYAPYKLWITGPQDAALNENAGQATYTLHRQLEYPWAAPYPIQVQLDADPNGAIPPQDYTLSGESVYQSCNSFFFSMPADRDQVQFTLTAIDNATPQPSNSLALTLASYTRDIDPPVFITADPDHPTTLNATILDNEPAPAPGNLTASPFSNTAVTLNWQDNSPNETAFVLEKSTDGGANWSQVKIVDPNTTTTQIDSLAPGRTYQFRLSAQNANASTQSDPTPAAKSNTLPDTDSALQPIESLNVPIDGSTIQTANALQANVEYQIQVKRTNLIDTTSTTEAPFGYGGDAEYAWPNDTTGSGQAEDQILGTDVGLQVTGAQETTIHWGQLATDPDHIYTINITSTGQPLSFHYRLPTSATPQEGDYLNVEISELIPAICDLTVTDNAHPSNSVTTTQIGDHPTLYIVTTADSASLNISASVIPAAQRNSPLLRWAVSDPNLAPFESLCQSGQLMSSNLFSLQTGQDFGTDNLALVGVGVDFNHSGSLDRAEVGWYVNVALVQVDSLTVSELSSPSHTATNGPDSEGFVAETSAGKGVFVISPSITGPPNAPGLRWQVDGQGVESWCDTNGGSGVASGNRLAATYAGVDPIIIVNPSPSGNRVFTVSFGADHDNSGALDAPAEVLRSITLHVVKLSVSTLQFNSLDPSHFITVYKDDGSGAYGPTQWADCNWNGTDDSADDHFPIAFVRSARMQVTARFEFIGGIPPWSEEVQVSAYDPITDELRFAPQAASFADGAVIDRDHVASQDLPNSVQCFDTFNLRWLVSYTDNVGWRDAGITTNQAYVVLQSPLMGTFYHSLAHIGCYAARGQSTQLGTVEAIWDEFADLQVYRVDSSMPMLYSHDSGSNASTADLLKSGKGRCGAWAHLFADTLRSQGLPADWVQIKPNGRNAPPPPPLGGYLYSPDESGFLVYPRPAQGNPATNYSTVGFNDHAVVWTPLLPNAILDPSYGARYEEATIDESRQEGKTVTSRSTSRDIFRQLSE